MSKASASPERIWLRSGELGTERGFDPAHAQRILDRQARTGHGDWEPVLAPAPSPSVSSAPAADDSSAPKRTRTARTPR